MSVDIQMTTEEDGRLLSARIADEIRIAVLRGEMRPGMRIRQELLAAKFGASRIPVREALKQLENEGLVVLAPNRGVLCANAVDAGDGLARVLAAPGAGRMIDTDRSGRG